MFETKPDALLVWPFRLRCFMYEFKEDWSTRLITAVKIHYNIDCLYALY